MTTEKDKVLIMDDEPNFLDWLIEYLEAKDFRVIIAVNVDEAIEKLNEENFRVAIFDLNVPASKDVLKKLEEKGSIHTEYRGLYAAEYARTTGLRGRQVIVYSVHDSEEVLRKCEKIGVQYLIKARPREFKKELNDILSYDPTETKA